MSSLSPAVKVEEFSDCSSENEIDASAEVAAAAAAIDLAVEANTEVVPAAATETPERKVDAGLGMSVPVAQPMSEPSPINVSMSSEVGPPPPAENAHIASKVPETMTVQEEVVAPAAPPVANIVLPEDLLVYLTNKAGAVKNVWDWILLLDEELAALAKEEKETKRELSKCVDRMTLQQKKNKALIGSLKSLQAYLLSDVLCDRVDKYLLNQMQEGKVVFVNKAEYDAVMATIVEDKKKKMKGETFSSPTLDPLPGDKKDGGDGGDDDNSTAPPSSRQSEACFGPKPVRLSPIYEETGKRSLQQRRFAAEEPTPSPETNKMARMMDFGLHQYEWSASLFTNATLGGYGMRIIKNPEDIIEEEKKMQRNLSRSRSRSKSAKPKSKSCVNKGNSSSRSRSTSRTRTTSSSSSACDIKSEMASWLN